MQTSLFYSIIVPVYNRPDEVRELLASVVAQTYEGDYEVLIIEDGSSISCEAVVQEFSAKIPALQYIYKANSGPGASRNYGMQVAQGNYYIILDSDCMLPAHYLEAVNDYLQEHFVDVFGGRDDMSDDFSPIQKAINYAMTSFFTTGGIRGSEKSLTRFEPRSFNMGISKKAFEATGGYGNIHPGEDPDLTIRLWKLGFQSAFIPDAYVFHKRRISWDKFYTQVNKFGQTRPILNHWHPEYQTPIHWLPLIFTIGLILSILGFISGNWLGIFVYLSYFICIFLDSKRVNKDTDIALLSIKAVIYQFVGYGIGFAYATLKLRLSKKKPEELFPHLFFK